MKKINLFVLGAVGVLTLGACGGSGVKQYNGTEVQGVTSTSILVGNTAATSGAFASVGVPFNDGLNAVFKWYNANNADGARDINFVHYDDEFDAAKGLSMTKKLVEEDKVFALVGHFGTNTVSATLDYIKEKGIPMVYAATGISGLYQEGAEGYNRCAIPVQPIYNAEGRVLLARALATGTDEASNQYGLSGSKIGVISTTDDAGEGMVAGVKRQAQELVSSKSSTMVYVKTDATQGTDHSSAVNALKSAGCDTVIICANQTPMGEIVTAMKNASFNANCVTSYVSANTATLGALVDSGAITKDRMVYTTAWLDATTAEGYADYMTFATIQMTYGDSQYVLNSYAMAGYIAGCTFLHGLNNLGSKDLVWLNYLDAMESKTFKLPMGGTLDFSSGNRFGVVDLLLNHISLEKTGEAYTLVKSDNIRGLADVWSHVPSAWRA